MVRLLRLGDADEGEVLAEGGEVHCAAGSGSAQVGEVEGECVDGMYEGGRGGEF